MISFYRYPPSKNISMLKWYLRSAPTSGNYKKSCGKCLWFALDWQFLMIWTRWRQPGKELIPLSAPAFQIRWSPHQGSQLSDAAWLITLHVEHSFIGFYWNLISIFRTQLYYLPRLDGSCSSSPKALAVQLSQKIHKTQINEWSTCGVQTWTRY